MENENLKPEPDKTAVSSEELGQELQDIATNNSRGSEKLTDQLNAAEWIDHISTNLGSDREHGQLIDGDTVRSLVINNVRLMAESDQRIALMSAFSAIVAQPNLAPGMKEQLMRDIDRVASGRDISDLVGKKD